MSKTRPAHAPHKLRYLTWGDNDLDSSTAMAFARSWTDSAHPLTETDSGAIILVKEVLTADKTLTLPSAKKGLYFKIVWGITDSAAFSRVIKTATAAETFRGTIVVIASQPDTDEGDFVTDQLNSHDEIQIVDDVIQGSWIDLVSDGDHWYIADSSILNNTDGFAAAVVLQDNS